MPQLHRLNRGGDRQSNRALHGGHQSDQDGPRAQAYVTKMTAEGHSKMEIIRCLKR